MGQVRALCWRDRCSALGWDSLAREVPFLQDSPRGTAPEASCFEEEGDEVPRR